MPRPPLTATKTLFLLLLAFHALFQSAFFGQLVVAPGAALAAAGVSPDLAPAMAGILTITAAGQALLAVLSGIALVWVLRGVTGGFALGLLIGAYFLCLGVVLAMRESAYVPGLDIVRGVLTLMFGTLAWRGAARSPQPHLP